MNYSTLILALICTMIISCKTEDAVTSEGTTITAMSCASATFSSTAINGIVYTGTVTVPYTGGNGVAYSPGNAIASTGVTGLTATLSAGTLISGSGSLTYTITGTPASEGTAIFPVTFGNITCNLILEVSSS